MADEAKVFARVCSISTSQLSSLCGRNSVNVDGVVSSNGTLFAGEDRLTLCLSNTTDFNCKYRKSCLLLDVCCTQADELNCISDTASSYDSLEDDDRPDLPIVLLLTAKFLSNYGIKSGQNVWLQKAHPLALSKVVLRTKRGQMVNDKVVKQICEYFRENNRVVRENDILKVPTEGKLTLQERNALECTRACFLNFEVLKSEPISQGVVDSQTNLLLLRESEKSTKKETLNEMMEPGDITSSANLNMLSLLVADFTTPLHGIWCEKPCKTSKYCKTAKLKVQFNQWMDLHQSFLSSGSLGRRHDIDDSHCLYVSLGTLMEIGVQNGSWVKIWMQENSSSEKCVSESPDQSHSLLPDSNKHGIDDGHDTRENPNEVVLSYHYAQLYAVDTQSHNLHENAQQIPVFQSSVYISHRVHVSPLLHFNLVNSSSKSPGDDDELFIWLLPYSFEKKDLRVSEDKANQPLLESVPPYAKEAQISLVQTVSTKPGYIFDKILERYFSKPRPLTVGDIFCIHFDGFKESMNPVPSDFEGQGRKSGMVYFKVIKLACTENETGSCLVDVDHTTVYQSSPAQSFVPVIGHPSQAPKYKSNYWNLPTPPGQEVATEKLKSIIKPYLRKNTQMMPAVLVTGPEGVGKRTTVMAVGRQLGLLTMNINCYDLIGDSVAATEARISNVFQKAITCRPCILLFRNIDILAKDRDGLEDEPRIASTLQQSIKELQQISTWPVVVIATSSSPGMSAQVHSCFLHEVKLQTPSEDERRRILEALASVGRVGGDVSLGLLSKRTAGLVLADFVSLFTKATSAASRRISSYYGRLGNELSQLESSSRCDGKQNTKNGRDFEMENLRQDVSKFGPTIVLKDLQDALEEIQSEHSDAIGAPKIPSVSWQDIGGLLDAKAELLDTIQLPLQHPELFASGLRRSGVLLYGPPGTGKTLLAKAVATECSLNFLSVKGPELINMYVGQSEENVRHVFTRAQSASPCVIFFDELDSLAPNRGRSGDSGGVMDRVVSQLLAELDGLHKSCDVFVIGATNRPDLLDPALLRPGRFDKLLYLGISEDHESQLKILRALTSKFHLSPDCDLESISRHCPLNFTGADLYALCSDAMLHAIKRCLPDHPDEGKESESRIQVNKDDFLEALKGITPSVPEHELQRYKMIRQQFTS